MSVIPDGNVLFVVDIEYAVPFEEVQPVLPPHMEFVKRCFAEGHFLVSGPKTPRSGGVVIATAPDRAAIEALIAGDPFCTEGVVTVTITEFGVSNMADALR
ncbi:hypothetical protein GCM10011415_30310 [Salipiger pallidus]|uniref:YCII-related domain-containing protein n=1 Tax=Salipiger pallidus TaxID=1775170 RepID=A0A8J3EHJ0_9RHOB|nr:YciI family protein [Salipiger pallidus]GGG79151.1 hypothetical protein GCM10011415_30310 [Salipiger pallidus]